METGPKLVSVVLSLEEKERLMNAFLRIKSKLDEQSSYESDRFNFATTMGKLLFNDENFSRENENFKKIYDILKKYQYGFVTSETSRKPTEEDIKNITVELMRLVEVLFDYETIK